jgi:hypothetical protein
MKGMRKNDLVDLKVDIAGALKAIEELEAADAYWDATEGEIPPTIPEMGRLRMKLWALSQTIVRAKRLPGEWMKGKKWKVGNNRG